MSGLRDKTVAAWRALHPNARRFLALSFLLSFAQSMFGLVFNLYVLGLGYDRDFMGLLGSLPALTVAALAVPLAAACPRLPARNALLAAVLLAAAGMCGTALSSGREALCCWAVVNGVSAAFLAIASFPLMARSSGEEERQALFSGQFAVSMVASFAGNLAAGRLAAAAAAMGGGEGAPAYRAALAGAAVFAALSAWPAARINEAAATESRGGLGGLDLRLALGVLAPQLLIGFGAGMVMPYLNVFFRGNFALGVGSLGVCMSLMPLAMACGAAVGPWLVRRQGRVQAIVTFQALSIPFLATMGFSGLLLPTLLAAFLRTMLMNASWPVYSVFMLSNFQPAQHAGASALYTGCWNLVFAAGARLSGTLQMWSGFTAPFLVTITCYSAASLLLSRKFLRTDGSRPVPAAILPERPA